MNPTPASSCELAFWSLLVSAPPTWLGVAGCLDPGSATSSPAGGRSRRTPQCAWQPSFGWSPNSGWLFKPCGISNRLTCRTRLSRSILRASCSDRPVRPLCQPVVGSVHHTPASPRRSRRWQRSRATRPHGARGGSLPRWDSGARGEAPVSWDELEVLMLMKLRAGRTQDLADMRPSSEPEPTSERCSISSGGTSPSTFQCSVDALSGSWKLDPPVVSPTAGGPAARRSSPRRRRSARSPHRRSASA